MKILMIGGTGTLGHAIFQKYSGQHDFTIFGRRPVAWANALIGNIERLEDVHRAVGSQAFDVVIHLAANKHVHVCETSPSQAVYANILGTTNVLTALRTRQPPRAVFVSTDKACQPCSIYGMSKLIAERLVQESVPTHPTRMVCLRLGNIFGSTGSVIPLWRRAAGHGQIIVRKLNNQPFLRFGITPSQAADLTMSAIDQIGVLVHKHMSVYAIDELARIFAEKHHCRLVHSEALAGERLHELLISVDESRYARDAGDRFILERTPVSNTTWELSTATESVANRVESARFLDAVEDELDSYLER